MSLCGNKNINLEKRCDCPNPWNKKGYILLYFGQILLTIKGYQS